MKKTFISAFIIVTLALSLTYSLKFFNPAKASDESSGKKEAQENGHKEGEEKGEEGHGEEKGEGGHGDHEESGRTGPDKAIQEAGPHGFKLSPEAVKTIGVKLIGVSGPTVTLPRIYLASSKDKIGVYRFRNGFFKFIPVTIRSSNTSDYVVASPELAPGDQVVTEGVGIVAISDVFSTDTAEYGH